MNQQGHLEARTLNKPEAASALIRNKRKASLCCCSTPTGAHEKNTEGVEAKSRNQRRKPKPDVVPTATYTTPPSWQNARRRTKLRGKYSSCRALSANRSATDKISRRRWRGPATPPAPRDLVRSAVGGRQSSKTCPCAWSVAVRCAMREARCRWRSPSSVATLLEIPVSMAIGM